MKNSTPSLINKLLDKKTFFVFFALSVFLPASSFSQNFWEEIYLPDSISCNSILVDDNDSIYIGVNSNTNNELDGVYKSSDFGITWNYKGLEYHPVSALNQDSEGNIYAGSHNNIYRSYDQGNSWEFITDEGFTNIEEILIVSLDTIFLSCWSGIVCSFDGGLTWNPSLLIYGNIMFSDIEISSKNELFTVAVDYMQDTGGVYKSVDWGENWDKVLTMEVTDVAINSNDEIFITTQWDGIFKSDDSGETWMNICEDILDIMTIEINDEDIMYVGCQNHYMGGVFVSYDNGENWEKFNEGLTNERVHELYIDHAGFLYALNKAGFPNGTLHRTINTTVHTQNIEVDYNDGLIVYPNPCSSAATITIGNLKAEVKTIEILNFEGKILFFKQITQSLITKANINLPHDMSSGMYYIRIFTSKNMCYYKKLIVN